MFSSAGRKVREPKKHLSAIQRSFLLAVSKCYRTTATATLEVLTAIEPLGLKIRELYSYQKRISEEVYNKKVTIRKKDHSRGRGSFKFTYIQSKTLGDEDYIAIYTDGCKVGNKVGAGFMKKKLNSE